MKKLIIPLILPCIFAIAGCQSTPDFIPEDLQPREYFQRAQEAVVERNDYDTALFYYQTFLERYPDDIQRSVEAEYEIAFIRYKQDDPAAGQLFEELLARYDAEGAELLPGWPRVLAEKLLEKIEAEAAIEETAAETATEEE
jgi:outer membrane protein assembly factor BamD (BamD/ComL family)